ncbi:MAG: P-loop NTPase fold protein [Bryobacteraceae bacterium]
MDLNNRQRQIIRSWPRLLKDVLWGDWRNAAFGYAWGALIAGLAPTGFGAWKSNGDKLASHWRSVSAYAPNVWFILVPMAIIAIFGLSDVTRRAFRSWRYGVISGAFFWSFVITTGLFWGKQGAPIGRGIVALLLVVLMLLVSVALRVWAGVQREKTLRSGPGSLGVDEAPSAMRDPESPIESWSEDRLGRAALVEVLALKILDTRTPVIALRGAFGDGKSSVLNLLRLQLGKSAVVVSFSSWLPNSELTLATDLFADIAAECNRHLIVPSLRKHLRKFAAILAGSVPYLKALPDILPPYTQRQEIRDLGEALSRMPKRVVVLLDEIDRMQKRELLTLLKIIRGAAVLPNLTFVCALNQKHVENVAFDEQDSDSHEFFEKFFPTAVDLPKPGPDVLQTMFHEQLSIIFDKGWFKNDAEQNEFGEALKQLWKDALVRACTNIRKTALLLNDVAAAAQLVEGEVNPLDLCALTAVRRFYPALYEIIWTNAAFFSNSYGWWKSLSFRSEQELAIEAERIGNKIKEGSTGTGGNDAANALLQAMFPARAKDVLGERRVRTAEDAGLAEAEARKRIAHPDFFPVYFRCEVPETVFSSREMECFIDLLTRESSDTGRRSVFDVKFATMDSGSIRRYDFIHKLSLRLSDLPIEVARPIALAISANAARLGDEVWVSERKRALGGIFAVAQQLSGSNAVNQFIAECIEISSSDVFAARLFKFSTTEKSRNQVLRSFQNVKDDAIQDVFTLRMSTRYGGNSDLTPARRDIYAFSVWVEVS